MFHWDFRVEYVDTDAMGVAHHSSYFRWLERARVEWLRSLGMPYVELEKQGYALPLRSASIEYLAPLRFDDAVRIELKIDELGKAGLRVSYVLHTPHGEASRATTDHVLCKRGEREGRVTWAPTRIPNEWREKWLPPNVAKSSTSL